MSNRSRHSVAYAPQSLTLGKAVQPNRRQTERHLSLLKNDRGAKEEDKKSMPGKLASGWEI